MVDGGNVCANCVGDSAIWQGAAEAGQGSAAGIDQLWADSVGCGALAAEGRWEVADARSCVFANTGVEVLLTSSSDVLRMQAPLESRQVRKTMRAIFTPWQAGAQRCCAATSIGEVVRCLARC